MLIKKLIQLVKPPRSPLHTGDRKHWISKQKRVSINFPEDFFEICRAYGSGRFLGGSLRIANLFDPNFPTKLEKEISYTHLCRDTLPENFPYSIHPDLSGLLPFGLDDDGNKFYWKTCADAEQWIIVCRNEEYEWIEIESNLTQFLIDVFDDKLVLPYWGDLSDGDKRFYSDRS